jgi:hypothetical protein
MGLTYFFRAIDSKLDRVPEKINTIKAHADAYIAENPPQTVMGSDGKTTLGMCAPIPAEIAVLVGEILYQLRSTLDHVAFQLVKLNPNGASLPAGWEENCQFPLMLALKTGACAPQPFGSFKNLPGISEKAHTFIESVQPYYGIGKTNNCLRFLKQLSNCDKHRHLILARSRSRVHESRVWANTSVTTGYTARDHGEEINLFDRGFGGDANVLTSFSLSGFIAFNEPVLGDANTVEIGQVLQWLFETVRDDVVPQMKLLMENP